MMTGESRFFLKRTAAWLRFVKLHLNKRKQDFWNYVVWTDETTLAEDWWIFGLFCSRL